MNTITLVFSFLVLGLSSLSEAALLKYGSFMFRQELAQNISDKIWMGSNSMSYGKNKVTTLGTNTSLAMGFGEKSQFDFNFIYNSSKISGPDFDMGGAKTGDKLDGISEVGGHFTHELLSQDNCMIDLNGYIGVRTPGEKMAKANTFLAIHDGVTKYDLGLSGFRHFGFMGLGFDAKYIYRPQLHNMSNVTLSAPIYIGSKTTVGPLLTMVNTFGGYDISTMDFMMAGMPFADKDEDFTSMGLSGNYHISSNTSFDIYYLAKNTGINTDQGKTFGMSINILMQ